MVGWGRVGVENVKVKTRVYNFVDDNLDVKIHGLHYLLINLVDQ